MKKLTSILFFLVFVLTAYGQNGLKETDFFILQNDQHTISLNKLENNKVKKIREFPITEKSIYTTDQKTRVAVLDTAKNSISLYNIRTKKEIKLLIPFSLKPKTILLDNDNLFIGGEMVKEMLVHYQIQLDKWHQLEIPVQVLFPGKAIDDLIINDSLLIAIDNIVTPKYVLFYRLNSMEKLNFLNFQELKSNGAYESIHKARITPNYLGLFSSTQSGYTGAAEHITIYDKINLTKSFTLSTTRVKKNYHSFSDFILVGDKIIIARKEKGLGVLKIQPSYFKHADKFDKTNISSSKIRYIAYNDEEIKKLTYVPNSTNIILTLEDTNGNISHKLLQI